MPFLFTGLSTEGLVQVCNNAIIKNMKGFGIEVKNTLLDIKHVERMGIAVWLYMWYLDKMTSISEEGIGLVLNGRVIKFEEVSDELGISDRTYSRWVKTLSENGYINVERAMLGMKISVNKAHKYFGKKSSRLDRVPPQIVQDTPQVAERNAKNGGTTIYNTKTIQETIQLPIWINKKAWEAWEQHRKEIKKKLTPTTMRLQLKFLESHKEDHAEIIRNSITNGWTGLFPIKKGFTGNSDAARVLRKQQEDKEAEKEREQAGRDNEAFRKISGDIKNLAKSKSI